MTIWAQMQRPRHKLGLQTPKISKNRTTTDKFGAEIAPAARPIATYSTWILGHNFDHFPSKSTPGNNYHEHDKGTSLNNKHYCDKNGRSTSR